MAGRDDKKKRGLAMWRVGRGFAMGIWRTGWGSPCQDARGSSFWRKDTYRLLSSPRPLVYEKTTSIHAHQTGRRMQLSVYQTIVKLCVSGMVFLAEWSYRISCLTTHLRRVRILCFAANASAIMTTSWVLTENTVSWKSLHISLTIKYKT